MKKILLIAISLIPFVVFGQNGTAVIVPQPPPPPPLGMNAPDLWGARYFHFGLNITPGIYFMSPNSSNNTTNGASVGFGYGANLEFYFTRNYGFVTGFELSSINAKYINTNANPSPGIADSITKHDESLQYLQVPIMLKMKTNPIKGIRYFGLVGLEVGFNLKATDDYSTVVEPFNSPVDLQYSGNNTDISKQTDIFRFSLVVGLGGEYNFAGATALQASITYNNCFTNMNNTSSNAINIKGIELMIGVLF